MHDIDRVLRCLGPRGTLTTLVSPGRQEHSWTRS